MDTSGAASVKESAGDSTTVVNNTVSEEDDLNDDIDPDVQAGGGVNQVDADTVNGGEDVGNAPDISRISSKYCYIVANCHIQYYFR